MNNTQEEEHPMMNDVCHLYEEVSDLRNEIYLLKLRIDKTTKLWEWIGVGGYFVFSIWLIWHFAWLIAF
jgi:hypothetical protein